MVTRDVAPLKRVQSLHVNMRFEWKTSSKFALQFLWLLPINRLFEERTAVLSKLMCKLKPKKGGFTSIVAFDKKTRNKSVKEYIKIKGLLKSLRLKSAALQERVWPRWRKPLQTVL